MPNIFVLQNGEIKTEVFNARVALSDQSRDGRAPLYDADGSALVIHSGADDYASQPSGAAGDRIACAEIGKTK